MNTKILYIVVPCFNEEEILEYSAKILQNKLQYLVQNKKISTNSKILLVDDGSTDKTWSIISTLNKENVEITGVKLSVNKGHQNALLAGLAVANKSADMTVSIDADLQDDVNAIDEMIEKFYESFDIVYGVRKSREKDSFFKKTTAEMFYKFMNFLGAKTVFNHADFRLMSKKALKALLQFEETNIFLRGIVPQLGFKTSFVYYNRKERKAGVSKYPISKMIAFAVNGITSCSVKLIHIIFFVGVLFFLIGSVKTFLLLIYKILAKEKTFSDITKIMNFLWLFVGITLISLAIIGEYVGKIYLEVKKRPKYIIEENLDENESSNEK